ncbi:maleylpyruvate isomerase family mycothiol-dependent enzyme [Nocardia asteroides]|uniref:maleylpyruvate isomerase family mycothiol-dependent enzyme n=1 Tax=Nocardia asteroides TaxID=1824 RepID=UPI001E334DDB|nr:maleylpyruvate isomerase family mycothiol-dependent enzyme [Nocardia asteroides]UGT56339.1 maleylpyruvate isomerase family mycothiol-dependent enzyme [Nocardia asteroides]
MTRQHVTDDLVWRAVAEERTTLADLLNGLPESAWDTASLCDGWRVRDVVAHLVIATRVTLGSLLLELIRARGNTDRLIHDTAVRLADRTPTTDLLADLRATIESRAIPFGTTPTDRLMDLLVHGQDIAVPLGLDRVMPIEAAQWSLERVWTMGAPFHARRRLAGHALTATDTGWTAGSGTPVNGTAAELLMIVTGREPVRP